MRRLADEAADFDVPAQVAPAVLNALLAENAALRAKSDPSNWRDREDQWSKAVKEAHPVNSTDPDRHKHFDTAMSMVGNRHGKYELVGLVHWLLTRATEAERRLAEAVVALEEIAAIEPKPFEGGLDMGAIRACEECRRYEGHPVQRGICNTHRRPIWDREKHECHEEKALGYRAKSIARTFLSKEVEPKSPSAT